MASQKAIDNSNRLRYIRALERFHKSMISYLSNTQELTKESYDKKIDNAQKLLNRVEEIAIYKGEIQDLQKLVKKMINYKDSDDDIQDIKDDILVDELVTKSVFIDVILWRKNVHTFKDNSY